MDSKPKESMISIQLELQKREHHFGKMIGVNENGNNSHGNHILSIIMDHILKSNEAVCFVALMHPQSHYQYVGNKIGFNLRSCVEKEQIKFIDAIQATQDNLRESKSVKMGENVSEWLCETIEKNVHHLHKRYPQVTVIIDDISVLLSLACDVKRVQCFLQWLLLNFTKINGKATSTVVLTHTETDDEESVRLAASVKYFSSYFANVTPLRTVIFNRCAQRRFKIDAN